VEPDKLVLYCPEFVNATTIIRNAVSWDNVNRKLYETSTYYVGADFSKDITNIVLLRGQSHSTYFIAFFIVTIVIHVLILLCLLSMCLLNAGDSFTADQYDDIDEETIAAANGKF